MSDSVRHLSSAPTLPPFLRPGDRIGLFSPSGPVHNMELVHQGMAVLRDMGYHPVPGPLLLRQMEADATADPGKTGPSHIKRPETYLAGSDRERASELRQLWHDPSIRGLMAVRGGYGCLRILPLIDFPALAADPKPVIGFSDLTCLAGALLSSAGLSMIHGPVLVSLARMDRGSRQSLADTLSGRQTVWTWQDQIQVHRPGQGVGRLICANLTTLVHLLATPWQVNLDHALLVIEDTGESAYRLDRLLTHLALAGGLRRLAGLMLGDFDRGRDDPGIRQRTRLLANRAVELSRDQDFPVWSGIPVGHGSQNQCLPFGQPARMAEGCLRISRYRDVGSPEP